MGTIAELVVGLKADIGGFKNDLKTKLAQAGKGASVNIGATGAGKTGAVTAGGITAGGAAGVAGAILGIYGFVKGIAMPLIRQSKGIMLITDILKNTVGTAFDVLTFAILAGFSTLKPIVDPIKTLVTDFVGKMLPRLTDLYNFTKDFFENNMAGISDFFTTYLRGAFENIITIWDRTLVPVLETVMNVLDTHLPTLTQLWDIMSGISGKLIEIEAVLFGSIFQVLGSIASLFLTIMNPLIQWMGFWFDNVVAPVIDGITLAIGYVTNEITLATSLIEGWFITIYNAIADVVPGMRKIERNTGDIEKNTRKDTAELLLEKGWDMGMTPQQMNSFISGGMRRGTAAGMSREQVLESLLQFMKSLEENTRRSAEEVANLEDFWQTLFASISTGSSA